MAREPKSMDHSLGVGRKEHVRLSPLTHHATENPHHLENQHLVKSSDEMKTPEYRGHMSRIKSSKRR